MGRRLEGKHVIIAGAGQTPGEDIGNGRATAIRFAHEGAELFLMARHIERAEETAAMIHTENPGAVVYTYAADATDEQQVKDMYRIAVELLGGIDILVDNIGIMLPGDRSLMTVSEDTYDSMVAANEKTALYLMRNAYPYMRERGGAVLLISSVAGTVVGKNANMYNITKSGMIRMGELFASMFAESGIRVNTIVLGMVQTAMAMNYNQLVTGSSRKEMIDKRNARIPLKGGQGSAWDTANAALFLVSDEARFITGACLPVDGGMLLHRGS